MTRCRQPDCRIHRHWPRNDANAAIGGTLGMLGGLFLGILIMGLDSLFAWQVGFAAFSTKQAALLLEICVIGAVVAGTYIGGAA
jgi:predicted lipid-binding transport protein (Tim44 family)